MIRPKSVRYIINEEKRTVVCISEGHKYDMFNLFQPYLRDKHLEYIYASEYMLPDKFIGVAKCHPEDTFSTIEGKKVAYEKLCKQYNTAVHNKYMSLIQKLRGAADVFEKLMPEV